MAILSETGNLRKYGKPPFSVAVVHGGPGAAGEMAPVAEELSRRHGVLEPLQTATSVDGQVIELHEVLTKNAPLPITLIGHSWGAWLSLLFASRYPFLIKKLILIGCAPLDEQYEKVVVATRLSRLGDEGTERLLALTEAIFDPETADKNEAFGRLGRLMALADSYDLLPDSGPELILREDINRSVWAEAEVMRSRSELLKAASQVRCPVIAIHGDDDPHPVEGVVRPLSKILKDFWLVRLEKCGHDPWRERYARDQFFAALENELS